MKGFDWVEYKQEGPLSITRMNNPERRNSLYFQMQRGLNSAQGLFERDTSCAVICPDILKIFLAPPG